MPVEMRVPKKIPVGRESESEVDSVRIDRQADGSFVVTHASAGGEETPTKKTFPSFMEMSAYVGDTFGESTQAAGALSGVMDQELGDAARRGMGIRGEAARRPTRPAGDQMAPAYAETQTDIMGE